MRFIKFIEYFKWFRTKFPTLKQFERKHLEEIVKIKKELKKKKEK